MAKRSLEAIPTIELIRNRDKVTATEDFSQGELVEELHQRFSWIAICVAVALAGYSTLMLGSFSRFGLWPQIFGAFTILILLEGVRGFVAPVVIEDPNLWILLYMPAILGVLISSLFLIIAGRPLVPHRGRGQPTTAAAA